jgi:hypothetical protein
LEHLQVGTSFPVERGNPEVLYGALRVFMGTVLAVVPGLAGRVWLGAGARSTSAKVVLRSLGVTDASIGLGTLMAVRAGRPVEPWLEAAVTADFGDLVASLAGGRRLPRTGRTLVPLFALGGIAAGVLLLLAQRHEPNDTNETVLRSSQP